ncbi:MAG TPA: lipid-binding SYLF domain-containing protein [Acetobacteraceae bacterium]|jgi:SH3 domain-containing YSC84-like protein 1|nr:lipid-binding SYLF domain-containing protein [Acetobacteraceae bacterium]
MSRFGLVVLALMVPLVACADTTQESVVQRLVDRSTLTVETIMTSPNSADVTSTLKNARAVMICPQVFKAGFILGGSGGGCVLVGRAAGGSWSAPAFYTIGSGSLGLQAGIEDASVMMMIMNDKALNAVINSQFKIGADASIAVATVGATIGGSTTAAMDADIVTFAQNRGLFAGISLDGALLSSDYSSDQAYYGGKSDARQIVIGMQANNPGANPLRAVLARYGS